ncbi:PIN domain-containing protein [Nonomuraea dietziae]|uniref:Putative nucleic acid-binding protein n=1 Tax=Nonomuraea dietziae TaxID=65515 RepID=A0A7W5V6S2_9ACTN|nr:PIN domain-containing protein [Nonomuraea dietziae]MBB3728300.1 putative nucleic acid-binding protein [Nonomuraea dietziae]
MRTGTVQSAIVYDAGALIAAESNDRRMWVRHRLAVGAGRHVILPVPVLAQVWRGSARQASLARLLFGCDIVDMTEAMGREAGKLCGKAGSLDVVDATVVMTAIQWNAAIVTSDPDDLHALLDAAKPAVRPSLIAV